MWCNLTFERCTSPSSSSPPTPRIFRLFRRLIRSVWLCFFIRGGWGLDAMAYTPDREVQREVCYSRWVCACGSIVGGNEWIKQIKRKEDAKKEKKENINFEFPDCYYPYLWRGHLSTAQAGRGIYQSTNNPLEDLTYATQLHNRGLANTGNP